MSQNGIRQPIIFECGGARLMGTLDNAKGETGLLIVSGGNEIRCGAYAGQAHLAAVFASQGIPVFRYDRRGVGDSEGTNGGFESTHDDIAAAITAFRGAAPRMRHIVAFGNCDAATALALFHGGLSIDALVLANPWIAETVMQEDEFYTPAPHPSPAAIRARYLARLKNPKSFADLLSGKIDLKKLAGGIVKAMVKGAPSGLAKQLANALALSSVPVRILIAKRDTTALEFVGVWFGDEYAAARTNTNITLTSVDTASHSFADIQSRAWLIDQISVALTHTKSL
jgi:exosortase A-associated hydrolase 1